MKLMVKGMGEERKGGEKGCRNDNKNDGGGSGVEWKRGKIVNYGKENSKFKKRRKSKNRKYIFLLFEL